MEPINKYFQMYLEECKYIRKLTPKTIKCSEDVYGYFSAIVPEAKLLEDLTSEAIRIFFKRLQTKERKVGEEVIIGIKDSTLVYYGCRLKTFCKWLYERKYIPTNPFDTIKLPRLTFTDQRALNGEQIKKIMGAIAQNAKNSFLLKRDLAIVGILTFCGLRRNELVSLQVQDLDIFNSTITVRAETSKSRKTRVIPINMQLRLHLSEYLEERKKKKCKTPYLFVSNAEDRPLTIFGLKHWVEKVATQSGVKFHVHRFRHTFATNLAMQDVGVIKIQKLLGHKDISMTQTYLRSVSTDELKDDVNKLSFENIA